MSEPEFLILNPLLLLRRRLPLKFESGWRKKSLLEPSLQKQPIVEAILHPEPEIVEVPEEPEDDQPDRRAPYSLNESIAVSEQLLETLMTYDDFSSTDSLYFSSLIDRLQKKRQASKQSTLDSFLMRLNKC